MSGLDGRRSFLRSTAAGACVGWSDWSFLSRLRPVGAAETSLSNGVVQFDSGIEALVRLIEETPRERLLEEVAVRIRGGTSYREIVAALLLAGIRNVEPRPSVGFKFHAVLVVNSAHVASRSSQDHDRWLPIFWALDYFKSAQARDVEQGNWTMGPVREAGVPSADEAPGAFASAMQQWDEDQADTAVAGLVRTRGAHDVFDLFAQFAARDFRSIGHKVIFLSNSWRTLQMIGWNHAEPVLRSLAYAMLNHHGEPNPVDSDLPPDRPWRRNQELAERIRPAWQAGAPSPQAADDLLQTLRDGSSDEACDQVVELLNRKTDPSSIYDALFAGAGELLMRQPGIVALHSVTTTNALHYAFQTASGDQTRRRLLLQNAAFLPMFREAMGQRGDVASARIDEMSVPEGGAAGLDVEQIFHDVSHDRGQAARAVFAYLQQHQDPEALMDAARRLIFLKGTNAHDYKFSSAVLEDYYHISPAWRDRFLAASVYNLRGSQESDNGLVERIRDALST